jgi:hypothetical protein
MKARNTLTVIARLKSSLVGHFIYFSKGTNYLVTWVRGVSRHGARQSGDAVIFHVLKISTTLRVALSESFPERAVIAR